MTAAPRIAEVREELDPPTAHEVLVCSYYRDTELRSSNLLYRLQRRLPDPESQVKLSEHLADETNHAWLWTERIGELGASPAVIEDGYHVRIGKRIGLPRHPIELLSLADLVEQRTLLRYQEHLKREDVPERTLEILREVSKDEIWHIDWVRAKARDLVKSSDQPERFEELLEKHRLIDRDVMAEIDDLERQLAPAAA